MDVDFGFVSAPRKAVRVGDWRDDQIRMLVHFSDGGAGMRRFDTPIAIGDKILDSGEIYIVVRVESPRSTMAFGHVWAALR